MESIQTSRIEVFYEFLVKRARYGVMGEKPLALYCTIEHLSEKGVKGLSLSELLRSTLTSNAIKNRFLRYGAIKLADPETSWANIVSSKKELLNLLKENRSVDEAFKSLTQDQANSIYEKLAARYQGI